MHPRTHMDPKLAELEKTKKLRRLQNIVTMDMQANKYKRMLSTLVNVIPEESNDY